MPMTHAGLLSLAVRFPSVVLDNEHWRTHHAPMVTRLEELALNQTWSTRDGNDATAKFDAAMSPYLRDPFRGCRSRRWFASDEDITALEAEAAREALSAAGLGLADVDLLIVGTFPPPQIDVGNAAFLAGRLGIECPAWNLEATCASTLIALQTALGLVTAGQARCVLVVNTCAYSRAAPSSEVVAIANGDGVSAMVVARTPAPMLLGAHGVNTAATCNALSYELDLDEQGRPCIRMRLQKGAGLMIRNAAERSFKLCVDGALARAGMTVADVDFFAFNAASAWMVPFYCSLLGIDAARTVDTHAQFANTGPVLVPTSLFYGAHAGRIPEGGAVLAFGIGNTSNAVALVMRWSGVRLTPVQVALS
jgi:3-oxoacyl-[acyl-carrier-protein] synthase III